MIYGERIRFRAIEKSDLPMFVHWLNDPEVRHGLSLFRPLSITQEEGWFENTLSLPLHEQPFVIEVRGTNEQGEETWTPIGNLGLMEIDWRASNAELGIMIGEKSYWNQGYGAEAVRLLVRHSFETLNLHRIWLRVYATNLRAIRSYEKAGFTLEGRKREADYQDGRYIDVLLMSILRHEWKI